MSSAAVSNPPTQQQSKSAKKKKGKQDAPAKSPGGPVEVEGAGESRIETTTNGTEGPYESPYIKDLNRNIRNIKKKLSATVKVDSIIAENPDVSLEDLLSSRKINSDQKAQAQKKPALQASLTQFEEQLAQFKQYDEESQKRLATEKSALETAHKEELEKVRDASVAEAKAEAKKESKENLLILSKFLRAAAAKRQGGDETSPENRAFEGALLLVYGGEIGAVTAIEKLISGSEELVPTVDQVLSEFTFKQVKDLSFEYAPYAAEEAWAEDVALSEPARPPLESEENDALQGATDPTIANAGLTEIDTEAQPPSNGLSHHVDTPTVPGASNIDAGAANAAGETNWDAKISASTEAGPDSWVEVPRDPAETETGNSATPADMTGTQSWAEDVPAEPTAAPTSFADAPAPSGGDGFHEVHHGRGRGRGEYRGGRGRGYRGDRGRGEGGRGRGRFRGQRGRGDGSRD